MSEFAQADYRLLDRRGPNDVTNPARPRNKDPPIYCMPFSSGGRRYGDVFMSTRSLAAGYAGIDNPLFYDQHHHHDAARYMPKDDRE